MDDADRSRVGPLLKRRREEQHFTQQDIAEKTGLSVGTVQAIEYNKYGVHDANIEKYAAAVGTSTHQLLHPESTVRTSDPLLVDLNREHLAIARLYMRAVKAVRHAVELLLVDDDITEEIAAVVVELRRAVDLQPQMAYWTLFVLERGLLMQAIAQRIDRDPLFEERLRDLLNEPHNSPTTDAPKRAPRLMKGKTK